MIFNFSDVTLISLKDRSQIKIEVTHHLMGTVSQLIQAVVKKANSCGGLDVQTKYAAAEVFNHRISRILVSFSNFFSLLKCRLNEN